MKGGGRPRGCCRDFWEIRVRVRVDAYGFKVVTEGDQWMLC